MKITDAELNINTIIGVQKGRIPPSTPTCNARHSDCFVYVLSGEAEYTFDGERYTAETGSVIYLAEGSNYSIKVSNENYTFIFIDFYFENGENVVFKNQIFKSKSILLLKNSFEKLYHLWKTGNFSDKIYCRAIIYNIYSEVARTVFSQYASQDRREQIERVAKYISENLHSSDLTVEQLSRMCNISEVHFRRIFSYIYHVSPIKFITVARINKAKELLISDPSCISEIAEKCGFQNHYYFSKVFKSETGMTPSKFRSFYTTNL